MPKLTKKQKRAVGRRTTESSKQRLMDRYGQEDQQAKRQAKRREMNDPAAFTRPLTPRSANDLASNAAQVRYGGAMSQVRQDQANVAPWFDQYRAQVMRSAQMGQEAAIPVIQAADAKAQLAGQTSQPATPPGVDPNAPGVQDASSDAALAAASRQALGNAFVTTLQGTHAANQTYFADRAGPMAAAAQLGQNVGLAREYGDLRKERGAFKQEYLGDLRGQAHTQRLENQAFGLDQYEAATEAADEARDDRRTTRNDRLERRTARQGKRADTLKERADFNAKYGISPEEAQDGISPAERKRMRQHEGGDGGKAKPGYTTEQSQKGKLELRKAVGKIQGKLAGKESAPASFWTQAYGALVNELDMDPAIARAAVQLVRGGKVGPSVQRILREEYGITKFPKGSKRKKPAPYRLRPTDTGLGTQPRSNQPG